MIKLIVGLGNPGKEYELTRHNVGFIAVAKIADYFKTQLKLESKFKAIVGKSEFNGQPIFFMMPQNYMNRSGDSVAPFANFFKILPENILVIHDELDIPTGSIRLKKGGGNGGHNGLKDIQAKIGSADFWRLRIGIGHPGDRNKVSDYVLHSAKPDEQIDIDRALDHIYAHYPLILNGKMQDAMLKLHSFK